MLRAISATIEVSISSQLLHPMWTRDDKKRTIGESSRHNECVYVCKFHIPCEIWYGFKTVSKYGIGDDQGLIYLRRGGPPPGPAILNEAVER